MNKQTNSEEKAFIAQTISAVGAYVAKNWHVLLLFILTFLASSAVLYLDTNTNETIASFAIEEYEVGQVADKTIVANKSISADERYPVEITEGEKVIKKGFAITDEQFLKLRKMADSPVYIDYRAFADRILFLMLLSALWFLLYSPVVLGKNVEFKELVFESVLFFIVFGMTILGGKSAALQPVFALPVVIPAALCIFLTAILFGQRSAFFFAILISLGVLCADKFELVPAMFTLASSLAAARIVRSIERRIDMVFAAILIAVLNVVFIIVLKVIFNAQLLSDAVFVLPAIAFNGFISGILVLGLLTPLEYILNTASVFRLMDLSDLNAPIMRHMLLNAPGTYNHSMMVASLAENACKSIGANPLLARVGAYYHDIGKIEQAEYFTENNLDGVNHHTDLNPSLSFSIIKSHVRRGVEKANQLRLPKQIIDIISEHHGNSVITYFYNEAKKKDESVRQEDYSYPGNPPTTKESAVVMLADVSEAACHSLDNPSAMRLEKFISQILSDKVDHHQLDNCALTFGELTAIKDTFVQILAGYYHTRIKYQNQKDPDSEKTDKSDKTLEQLPDDGDKTIEMSAESVKKAAGKSKEDTPVTEKGRRSSKKEAKGDKQ